MLTALNITDQWNRLNELQVNRRSATRIFHWLTMLPSLTCRAVATAIITLRPIPKSHGTVQRRCFVPVGVKQHGLYYIKSAADTKCARLDNKIVPYIGYEAGKCNPHSEGTSETMEFCPPDFIALAKCPLHPSEI